MRNGLGMLALVVAASMPGVACGGRDGSSPAPSLSAVVAAAYPHETVEDWVSYGDAVVIAHVVGVEPIPPSRPEIAAGEGLVMRRVAMGVVRAVWTRPGARAVPDQVDLVVMGWEFKDDWRASEPSALHPAFASGDRFVLPVAWQGDGPDGGWSALNSEEILAMDGARVGDPVTEFNGPALAQFTGSTPEEIAARLDATEPDPVAADNGDLPPRDRWQAVAAARQPAAEEGSSTGLDAHPHAEVVDWVSYGDAFVQVRVVGNTEIPPSQDEIAAGEGIVMRRVSVVVEDVLWERPGAVHVPDRFEFVAMGWTFHGDYRVGEGPPRRLTQSIGDRLAFPAARYAGGSWAPIHPDEILELDGDGELSALVADEGPAVVAALNAGYDGIRGLLEATEPDPAVVAFGGLPPQERVRAATEPDQGPVTTGG